MTITVFIINYFENILSLKMFLTQSVLMKFVIAVSFLLVFCVH